MRDMERGKKLQEGKNIIRRGKKTEESEGSIIVMQKTVVFFQFRRAQLDAQKPQRQCAPALSAGWRWELRPSQSTASSSIRYSHCVNNSFKCRLLISKNILHRIENKKKRNSMPLKRYLLKGSATGCFFGPGPSVL